MRYINLGELIYSGLSKDTVIHVYNSNDQKIQCEPAKYVDERLKVIDIYCIELFGSNSIKIKIDTAMTEQDLHDEQ